MICLLNKCKPNESLNKRWAAVVKIRTFISKGFPAPVSHTDQQWITCKFSYGVTRTYAGSQIYSSLVVKISRRVLKYDRSCMNHVPELAFLLQVGEICKFRLYIILRSGVAM